MSGTAVIEVEERARQALDHEVERTESSRAWWRRHLEGLDGVLELPADAPRPSPSSTVRRRLASSLDRRDGWLGRLDLVAARPSPEVDTAVLVAGVAALCSRLTGRLDLAVGTPVPGAAGRPGLGVLRFRLHPGRGFGEILAEAQRLVREAALRGPVPPDLAPSLPLGVHPERCHPLTQVVVATRSPGEAAPDPAALRLTAESPSFDLAWVLDRSGAPPCLVLDHDPEQFATAGPRFLTGLQALLAHGLTDPGTPLASLALA